MDRIKKFLFTNQTTSQTVAKNSFWLFASEAFSRLLKMVLVIYAARLLGANGWGVFSYALSIGSLAMIFSDIGLGNLVTREVIQKKDTYRTFITAAFFLKSIILIVSVLLVIFVAPSLSHIPEANILFPIVGAIFLFDSLRDLGFAINRASEKMEREMIVKTIMGVVILILGFILLTLSATPRSIAIAYAMGSLVGCVAIAVIVRKEVRGFIAKLNMTMIKSVLQTAWPFALVTLIGSIMANTDVYMLGVWKNATEIGLYTSMQRIQQFTIIIPSMISTALFPLMSHIAYTEKKQLGVILGKGTAVIMMLGIPIVFGGIVLSGGIVHLLFGAEYADAVPILRILMIMLLASFPLVMLSSAVLAYNEQKNLVLAYGFGVVANILLNIVLIPKYGAVGSAVATLVSIAITTLIIWKKLQLIQPFSVLSKLKRTILASVLMACMIWLFGEVGMPVLMNIAIGIVFYFGALALLKEPLIREIRTIIHI